MDQIRCGELIKRIHDTIERDANNQLRSKELTFAQMHLLIKLHEADGGTLALKELERRLHVSQATTAGLVARLEQKGFAEGFGDAGDKRIKNVRITRTGNALCEEARENIEMVERKLLSAFTDGEKQIFLELLQKAAKSIA
jgi:DNA-binding MarR family transcriptional regulator